MIKHHSHCPWQRPRIRALTRCAVLIMGAAIVSASAAVGGGRAPADWLDAHETRRALIEAFEQDGAAAAGRLTEALADEREMVRRTAAHLLVRMGEPFMEHVDRLLDHEDFQVRAIAVRALAAKGRIGRYRKRIESDPSPYIRRDAEYLLLADRRLATLPLPVEGWRFRTDPENVGREEGWFRPGLDEEQWRDDAVIETAWAEFLGEAYIGPGWYRRGVDVPDFPEGWDRAEIAFDGVDEMAWVWINGEFVGEHDIGVAGWNQPFELDITEAVQPGAENQVTIRAENTTGAGGVWQPVEIRVYRRWRPED